MTYSKDQLIEALYNEYVYICHDDFDPDVDISPEDYRLLLKDLTIDKLIEETSTDEDYTLEEYMGVWS